MQDSAELRPLNLVESRQDSEQKTLRRSSSGSISDTGHGNLDVKWKASHLKHTKQEKDRGVWANKVEFFLAIMGYTVGIGSVWRFPILCSRNGGGAFLIPFFFFLITSGGPLYYLEVCLGQFTGESAGLAFEYCPLFKGLGMLQVALSLLVVWYLIFILVWVLYFLYSSFQTELPWTTCNNYWNTVDCSEISTLWSSSLSSGTHVTANNTQYNSTFGQGNSSFSSFTFNSSDTNHHSSSAYEFWEYHAIGRSREV